MVKKSDNGTNVVPPFLAKCYEMVADQSTDRAISWSDSGESFVIWDVTVFSRDLLPKFFKHSNFSSFMRQLNIYGFRKMGFDRWEFYNEHFIKDQTHLLGNIKRRKHPHSSSQQKITSPMIPEDHRPISQQEKAHHSKSTLEKEVEALKRDKKAPMQELAQLRVLQENSQNKLILLRHRMQGMEKSQQQLLSSLTMVIQNPRLLVQLLQSKEGNRRVAESGKITISEDSGSSSNNALVDEDGMIVRYQPMEDDDEAVTTPTTASSPEVNSTQDGVSCDQKVAAENKDFFMNLDFSSFENFLHSEQPRAPIIFPEFDLRAVEQFLLSSPGRDDAENAKLNGEGEDGDHGIFGTEMDLESLICGIQTENGYLRNGSGNNMPENLEFVTEQMELLSPGRDDGNGG